MLRLPSTLRQWHESLVSTAFRILKEDDLSLTVACAMALSSEEGIFDVAPPHLRLVDVERLQQRGHRKLPLGVTDPVGEHGKGKCAKMLIYFDNYRRRVEHTHTHTHTYTRTLAYIYVYTHDM